MTAAGLRALAVAVPRDVRTNAFFRDRYPALVEAVAERAAATPWSAQRFTERSRAFDEAMAPFLADPFRGSVERRVLAPGQKARDLAARAATDALRAAALAPADVDLLIACAFVPAQLGVGDATFLARDLGLGGAAWNMECACASSVVALETAAALVRSGTYRNVLVTLSCNYSQTIDPGSVLAWPAGDAAAAYVVGEVPPGDGVLATDTVHTAATCATFRFDPDVSDDGVFRYRMASEREAGTILRETSEAYLRGSVTRALARAGATASDIALVACSTPTAWFAPFAARVLGVPESRVVDSHARFGNVGPVLVPLNLQLAAAEGRLCDGDLVLLYAIGSVSAASAAVVRWRGVAVAPLAEVGA